MRRSAEIRTVDEQAVQAVLRDCEGTVTEVILRLAWGAGLIPEEMRELVWSDVDFESGEIHLPDRTVPVDAETLTCLRERHGRPFSSRSEYVILSDHRNVRMNRSAVFHCAREALVKGGLEDVTLMSLRYDFILRQLERRSKSCVARMAGVTLATLETVFAKQLRDMNGSREAPAEDVRLDPDQLTRILLAERGSPAALTVWLTWKHGLLMKEIVSLTWEDVDLEEGVIMLEDREVFMDEVLMDWLEELRAGGGPGEDSHVVLTPHSRKPYDGPRLSRVVKELLVRAGLDRTTLRDLYLKGQNEKKEKLLLRRAGAQGFVTREETMKLFQVGWRPAWDLLHRLVKEEKLVRVGARYYLPGTAVPPEQHYEVVRAYLEAEGGAYRKELANLLHIEEKQCGWILTGFVADGKLARKGQRYVLPEKEVVYR